jgi:hypothetical protein
MPTFAVWQNPAKSGKKWQKAAKLHQRNNDWENQE